MVQIMNRMKTRITKMSIIFKIAVLFDVVMIFTIVLVASFININYAATLKEKEIALGTKKLEKFSDYMNEKYNRIYNLSNYIHSDQISGILADINEDSTLAYHIDYINATKVFAKGIFSADSDISDVILVCSNHVVYSNTAQGYSQIQPSYDFMNSREVLNLLDSSNDMQIILDTNIAYTLKEREAVVSFMGKIFDTSKFPNRKLVGVYIINIPLMNIQSAMTEIKDIEGSILLMNQENEILFSTDNNQLGDKFEIEEGINIENNDFIKVWDVGLSGLKAAYMFDEKALYTEINKNMHKTYLILFIALSITLLWSWLIYIIFNKRVKILTESMKYVQSGDFSHRIPIKTQDEIGILSESFNDMCSKLNEYITKVYYSEIKLKNAEINALQAQINPHFLYNTLESIKAEALVHDDKTTAQMISLLGNLFRWSCKIDNKIVLLEDELDYINTYLELQQLRFQNNTLVEIEVEDDLLDYGVPKLIMQPIIENTIKHGLRNGEKKNIIKISIKEKPDHTLEVSIKDNGNGIEKERLRKIQCDLRKDNIHENDGSIGIQNVHQRLRLMFGIRYGLHIESKKEEGTIVKLLLPAMSKKEMELSV